MPWMRGGREVEKKTELMQKSGRSLEEILERINEVSMQVNQIATAAEEQTAATDEVASNIQQINDGVHGTAQGAEEGRAGRGAAEPRQPFQAVVRRDYT